MSYEQNSNWTRILPKQPEIKAYLQGVSQKYDLTRRMHFRTEVEECVWNDQTSRWIIHLHNLTTGERWTHESDILFSCAGGLVKPRRLDVPGVESFKGPIFHTACYDHSVDLRNKHVAVIGNGCTGVQLVPALVNDIGVKSLTHFVRSKHWIFPPFDRPYPSWLRWVFRNIPGARQLHRMHIYLVTAKTWPVFLTDETGAKARARLQPRVEEYMRKAPPAEYVDKLVPDYEIGCTRRIFDSNYLPTLHKPNVELINTPIREVVPEGIRTDDGVTKVDAIILANGFDLQQPLAPMTIKGRDGVDLHQKWIQEGGTGTYSCVAVSGFPNMFLVAGPNTATGHTSVIIAAENTANLSLRVLKPVLDGRAKTVEPLKQAEDDWNDAVQEASQHRIWVKGGCQTWYLQGLGRIHTLYPWDQTDMWRRCFFPEWKNWMYRTQDGTPFRYRGLDRWFKPWVLMLLLVGITGWYLRRR